VLIAALAAAAALGACAHPAMMALSLLPDGTFATLLGNMQSVSEPNRLKLAELEKKGDWQGIADFAQQNLQKDSQNAEWWLVRGYAFLRLEQYARAAESFQEAVRFEPGEIVGWNLLGESYRLAKQPERAVRTMEAALRISQDSPESWYILAESYHDLGRFDRAAQAYQQTLVRDSRSAAAWYGLAVVNFRMGKKAETEEALAGLRRVDPQLADRAAAQLAAAEKAPTPR
jgi:predicted Zn-dependent protease